jgi:hypothetical protein
MFVRAFGGAAAVAAVGLYLHSAFGPSYSRNVSATPAEVRSALEDLDIRNAPGAPASDPSRSGGVAPTFQLTEQGDDMIWTIMSGDKVAVRLIAHLAATDGGQHTKVTAEVERGDAPDDYVAPAFRSTSLTRSLFGMVLDQELDQMHVTQSADSATCQKILADFEASAPSADQQAGFGGVARTALKLNALEGQLKAAGCPVNAPGNFEEPKAQLTADSGAPPPVTTGGGNGGAKFEPGKPMLDLSKH